MNTAFARTEEFDRLALPSSVRWFKLYDDLAEFGSGLAYPCKWDSDSHKWVASTKDDQRDYVYSTIAGMTGSQRDFLPCWHNGQVWEVLRPGTIERIGKADASIQNAATGTVSIWTGTAGSESDSGDDIENCYNRGRYIYEGEFVRILTVGSGKYVLPLSGSQLLRGQTDAAISKGSSGTISVYTDGGTDTTDNITATNLIASITASGKKVFVQWCNGTYFITQCECPL